jgi:Arc/MetJ-type ribon-helix-helix transcriptional regulator
MTAGMKSENSEKIAISVPPALMRKVRKAVKAGRAPSVSAYVARALENETKRESLEDLLNEMLLESGGPPTEAELLEARRALKTGSGRGRR